MKHSHKFFALLVIVLVLLSIPIGTLGQGDAEGTPTQAVAVMEVTQPATTLSSTSFLNDLNVTYIATLLVIMVGFGIMQGRLTRVLQDVATNPSILQAAEQRYDNAPPDTQYLVDSPHFCVDSVRTYYCFRAGNELNFTVFRAKIPQFVGINTMKKIPNPVRVSLRGFSTGCRKMLSRNFYSWDFSSVKSVFYTSDL